MSDTVQEHGDATVTLLTEASWNAKLGAFKVEGRRAARRKANEGHVFEVAVLAPHEMRGGSSVPLSGAMLKLNWKLVKKREMVESAREFLSNAYICDSLDPALPFVLSSVIEERSLYAHSIGEFFLLYGRFQQKHQLKKGEDTETTMMTLIGGDQRYLKSYVERGKRRMVPLPYAVRNIFVPHRTQPQQPGLTRQ